MPMKNIYLKYILNIGISALFTGAIWSAVNFLENEKLLIAIYVVITVVCLAILIRLLHVSTKQFAEATQSSSQIWGNYIFLFANAAIMFQGGWMYPSLLYGLVIVVSFIRRISSVIYLHNHPTT